MRGKPPELSQLYAKYRITPADAGKTGAVCSDTNIDKGSPPRMRGKHDINLSVKKTDRITPADAGKTDIVDRNKRYLWDHPRGCGENLRPDGQKL